MKVLLHLCCGPCSPGVINRLRDEGHEVSALFVNPNVHPYTEYQARLEAARAFCGEEGVEFLVRGEYDVFSFVAGALELMNSGEDRCEYCYGLRLDAAARTASEVGCGAFTSTILASPYQKHELARRLGEKAAEAHGVQFLYADFRDQWKECRRLTFERELYRQKYCGCIFSEQERYMGEKKNDGGGEKNIGGRGEKKNGGGGEKKEDGGQGEDAFCP